MAVERCWSEDLMDNMGQRQAQEQGTPSSSCQGEGHAQRATAVHFEHAPPLSDQAPSCSQHAEPPPRQASSIKRKVLMTPTTLIGIGLNTLALGYFAWVLIGLAQGTAAKEQAKPRFASWRQDALELAYKACYDGCVDCVDEKYALDACTQTAKVNVTGVICNGNQIWNWHDRYPDVCLQAIAKTYKAAAEEKMLKSHGWRAFRISLALTFTLIVGGLSGWLAVRFNRRKPAAMTTTTRPARADASGQLICLRPLRIRHSIASTLPQYPGPPPPSYTSADANRSTDSTSTARTESTPIWPPSRDRTSGVSSSDSDLERASEELNKVEERPDQHTGPDIKSSSASHKSNFVSRRVAIALGLIALFGNTTAARICKDNVTTRHFTNPSHTIFGNVRGWLASERSEYACHCRDVHCPPKQGRNAKSSVCDKNCDTCVRHTTSSLTHVDNIKPKIGSCGFGFVDEAVGQADQRVANALIEKNWLTTITVNTFNVTDKTAQQVWCLYGIGHQLP
ncbi:hypothetical protein FKW77_007560 [Venturia effusa]|uniref:Uncharacterized protein n=1 Tax=Venturia effusa TaxID=50376 RepID=A0A517LB81_9PEZI|nr:hypothetical protein FKW77_007560 [Venturia effusa]